MNGWRYYNHAVIPCCAPHEKPDTSGLWDGSIWNEVGGRPLFARWTSHFDCRYETQWWYLIKDTPLDLQTLKAKRRYEINKGIKNFAVRLINPCDHLQELYDVQVAAFTAYPEKYRPTVEKEKFMKEAATWDPSTVFGAFSREDGVLRGYAIVNRVSDRYARFSVQKTTPAYEKFGLNAALVHGILMEYIDFLTNGGYICDGERSINHETQFQDYLEKYFGFRKAYCHLNIQYRPFVYAIVKILFPLRKFLLHFDDNQMMHNVNAVLRMEEIRISYQTDRQGQLSES